MAKLVSKVYGDALFEAAMERDMLSPVYEEVQSLQTILMENADLVQFLNHPQIIKEEKLKVVENIFKGRVSDDLMGFLETVIEKGRQKELPKILDYFVNRVKEYKKIGIVTVTSAVELSAEQKARTTYDNILRLVKDPEVCDPIRFLRQREIVHFQRFGEGLRMIQDDLDRSNFYMCNPEFDPGCGK